MLLEHVQFDDSDAWYADCGIMLDQSEMLKEPCNTGYERFDGWLWFYCYDHDVLIRTA